MTKDTLIDLDELTKGLAIDTVEHPYLIYEATQDVAAIIDGESGELLICEYLH